MRSTDTAQPGVPSAPARILIADDDEWVIKHLTAVLVPAGYDVEAVADGLEALARVQAGSFDLVILDMVMPRMDGIELVRALRQDPHLERVPVIMLPSLTALVADNEQMAGWLGSEGVNACLFKPRRSRPEILALVQRLLGTEEC